MEQTPVSRQSKIVALTLHQPWAWCVAYAGKPIENRDWKPPGWLVGRYLAIHAGKTYDDEASRWCRAIGVQVPPRHECKSGIIAVAKLGGYVESDVRLPENSKRWFVGQYGWLLSEVVALEPIICKGSQGLWELPPDVLAQVRAQWAARRGR